MRKLKSTKSSFIVTALLLILSGIMLSGCMATSSKALRTDESQVAMRNIQTRAFDITDKKQMMRTIITTMQDLDFVIDKADLDLGAVTGSKFMKGRIIKMTVTVRPRGKTQLLVRASARCGIDQIKDAETYQDFFVSLGKSMFLTVHEVD
jgi:hypothetical protein